MAVTATFGMVAAAHALKKLALTTPAGDTKRWPEDSVSL